MLLYLSDCIIEKIDRAGLSNDEQWSLNVIADCVRRGYHLVSGNRPVFDKLAALDGMDAKVSEIFRSLGNRSAQFRNIFQSMSVYVNVCINEGDYSFEEVDGVTRINVPLGLFAIREYAQPSILLMEHYNDMRIYSGVLDWYRSKYFGGGFSYNFERCNGNGGNTCHVFENLQSNNRRLTLCVTDSDKWSPDDGLGGTAKDVNDINNPSIAVVEHLMLEVRELENLIPLSVLKVVKARSRSNGIADELLSAFEQLIDEGRQDSLLYWDYKKGVICKKITKSEAVLGFWDDIYSIAKSNFRRSCSRDVCVDGSCDKAIFPSWPLQSETSTYIEAESISYDDVTDRYLYPILDQLGRVLFSWGVTSGQRST